VSLEEWGRLKPGTVGDKAKYKRDVKKLEFGEISTRRLTRVSLNKPRKPRNAMQEDLVPSIRPLSVKPPPTLPPRIIGKEDGISPLLYLFHFLIIRHVIRIKN